MTALAVTAALALALALGVGDAPNATAALVASRSAHYRTAVLFAGTIHALGAVVGGSAVAVTITKLLRVDPADVPMVVAAAAIAAVAVTLVCARLRIPTSASFGLIGGLAGAGVVAGGVHAVSWGGFNGLVPTGVIGVLVGMLVSPLVGCLAGVVVDRLTRVALRRASRQAVPGVRAGIWATSSLVALTGGANDGQKAMGVGVAALAASGAITGTAIPLWLRLACALFLAAGTTFGGHRVIRTVSSGIYREGLLEAFSAQVSAAAVIGGATVVGAPVSSSNVVASAVIGVGLDRRPRHIRWHFVGRLLVAWALTAPLAAAVAALLTVALRPFA